MSSSLLALRIEGVHKRFGAVTALRGVDLEVRAGEAHALLGENGAGKSTLMKVLSGVHPPDAGRLELFGKPYAPGGPREAQAAGVAMIYQELNLAPHLTVAENVTLGREPHRFGFVDRPARRESTLRALALLARAEVDPDRRVADLGPGARQAVEIARALAADARLLVMDEPTSSLSGPEVERLTDVVRRVCAEGVAVIYISHFLDEVREVAERYTVLRDGATVGHGELRSTTQARLIEQMVGRPVEDIYPKASRSPGAPALSVAGIRGAQLPADASFTLKRGEVLGIAGLVGAGRTEMLRALYGLDPMRAGTVRVGDAREDHGAPVHVRVRQGVGYVSESRKEEGLSLTRSVAENLTLSRLRPLSRAFLIDRAAQARAAERAIDRLGVRCSGPWQATGELSGGNQQKVALARLLHQDAQVWLLDEPTRGVDVGSKVEIYRLIDELAAEGRAVLLVSSYLPELLGVADRIAVMCRGRLGECRPVSTWSEPALLAAATSGEAP